MRKYTRDLYARLEAETGPGDRVQAGRLHRGRDASRTGSRSTGGSPRSTATAASTCTRSRPAQVRDLFPLARTDDILAGFYVEEDGRANPVDVTMALAKGARMQGATIIEGVPVTGVLTQRAARSPACARRTATSRPSTSSTAPACGRASSARASGVNIPLQAAEHYYLITEHDPRAVAGSWPVLEDPASYGYFREEVGGLMIGLFEPVCAPWKVEGVPEDFSFGELPPDWDRMGPYVEKAMRARADLARGRRARSSSAGPRASRPICSRSSARRPS